MADIADQLAAAIDDMDDLSDLEFYRRRQIANLIRERLRLGEIVESLTRAKAQTRDLDEYDRLGPLIDHLEGKIK